MAETTPDPRPDAAGLGGQDAADPGSGAPAGPDLTPTSDQVAHRAELLPEERAAGSADPQAQAEAILAESIERTEHPDPDSSSQSAMHGST